MSVVRRIQERTLLVKSVLVNASQADDFAETCGTGLSSKNFQKNFNSGKVRSHILFTYIQELMFIVKQWRRKDQRLSHSLLMLSFTICLVVLASCKDDVNPVDKLMGFYEGQTLPALTGSTLTFHFKKADKDNVSLELLQFRYKRGMLPNGGWQNYYLDYTFPDCKIIFVDTTRADGMPYIDTTGLGINKPIFAKIIDNETNKDLGTIREYETYALGKTFLFMPNFYIRDTIHIVGYATKLYN